MIDFVDFVQRRRRGVAGETQGGRDLWVTFERSICCRFRQTKVIRRAAGRWRRE
jgi:hypothetical protein